MWPFIIVSGAASFGKVGAAKEDPPRLRVKDQARKAKTVYTRK